MNYFIGCSLLLFLVAITSTAAFAAGGENTGTIRTLGGKEIAVAEMDEFVKAQMDSLNVKGISIAIINNGQVVYHRSFGIAGIADACSLNMVNDQTLFQAASMSKPIFAFFCNEND